MENEKQLCCICKRDNSLLEVHDKWICENCLQLGIEKLVSPWKAALEKLLKEYTEACSNCMEAYDPRDIHKAKITGRKIKAIFDFLGVPKKHGIFLEIRKMDTLLKKLRETDVMLDEILGKSEENKVYTEMIRLIRKRQKKLHRLLAEEFPTIMNESFFYKKDLFINKELFTYVVQLAKNPILLDYEGSFQQSVENYHQLVEEKGKTAPDTIEAIHSVRNTSKSLRYIYNILNEFFSENDKDNESYYRDLQFKLGEINDVEDLLQQLKKLQDKIDAPKSEIQNVKKELKARLNQLIEEVEIPKGPVK